LSLRNDGSENSSASDIAASLIEKSDNISKALPFEMGPNQADSANGEA